MKWKRPKVRKFSGLGDVVQVLAAPVAASMDKHLGTNLSSCKGCQKRKERMNDLFPLDFDNAD